MDDQWQCNKVPTEDSRATDKFQNSPIIVTSKDTETGGGLNLGGKRNKPNRAGPSVQNQKSSMSKPTAQEARKLNAVKTAAKDPKDQVTVDHNSPASSTPKKLSEIKRITRQTKEKEILDTFQNKDMTPEEWDELAEQVLTRGVQNEAKQMLNNRRSQSMIVLHQVSPMSRTRKKSRQRLGEAIDRLKTRGQRDMAAQCLIL